jgi:steroid delta-isomerase-like uncharacterized protein
MTVHQLITTYVDAFNADSLDGQLSVLSDTVLHEPNEGAARHGLAAFREFKAIMNEHFSERLTQVEIQTSESRGACEFVVEGRYIKTMEGLPPAHGQNYSIRAAFFVECAGGKITRLTSYYNLAEWTRIISE